VIYFVQLESGSIKIGFTDNLEQRLSGLSRHYGSPVSLLAAIPGGLERESEIHDRFAHLRFGRTEQFRPALDLLDFIGKPLLVGPNPETVELQLPAIGIVRIRKDVLEEARTVAALRRIDVSDYLSGLLKPLVSRDLKAERRKIAKADAED
jgi:hypothetical protein